MQWEFLAMKHSKGLTALLAISATALTVTAAAAAPMLAGASSGTFTSLGNNNQYTGITSALPGTNNVVLWGSTGTNVAPVLGGDETSSLSIDNYEFNAPLVVGNNSIKVGSFSWENASTTSTNNDNEFIANATLKLNFTAPPPGIGGTDDEVVFRISSTDNSSSTPSDLVVESGFDSYSLIGQSWGGATLLGFTFAADNAFVFVPGVDGFRWRNTEGELSRVDIFAEIAYVPLPAPFLLLLGGMAGLGFVSRKRKAA
jgi:hypothetical protein